MNAPAEKDTVEMTLRERDHSEGCPGIDNDDRLEWHDTVATTGKFSGQKVTVLRCPDCGGQRVTLADSDDDDEEN